MSPRGRAPWPPALTTGALNHLASFLPSLPPQQLVELREGAAVRGAAGGEGSRYHLLALNCLPGPTISCIHLALLYAVAAASKLEEASVPESWEGTPQH